MRICLVSQEYPPETAHGGIGTQTYLKAHGLADRGHEVVVLSRSTCDSRTERTDRNVRVVRVPGAEARLPLYTEAADWLSYSLAVAAELASLSGGDAGKRVDLIDFPEWAAEGLMYLVNRTEWDDTACAVQLHGPLVMFARTVQWPDMASTFYRVGTFAEGTCVRLADAVFSSSACSADWCAREYGVDRDRIPVLHTGVDTDLFRPPARQDPDRPPTVVFAGRISGDKGVPLLVRAAALLRREIPSLHLRLLGRGDADQVSAVRRLANDLGMGQALEMPGFVPRERLPSQLGNADVFAAPSVYEPGPGLVNLEAMACGLPVVACGGAGAAEVVEDGIDGLLVPPNDVGALAGAIGRLLTDRQLRAGMADTARRHAVERGDSRLCVGRIEQFYLEAVAARKGRK